MKEMALILIATITLWQFCLGCRASKGMEAKESFEEDAPQISMNTIQTAVTGLMMQAGVNELDASYDEVDTREEVRKVTAGNGAFSLEDHLSTSYPISPAYDISKNGRISID